MVGDRLIMGCVKEIYRVFLCGLSVISPVLNSKISYLVKNKKKLNLKTPATFKEKIIYLKLFKYNQDELVKKCADKWCVRQYIEERGYGKYLIPLIDVYDNVDAIDFQNLPNAFALKWSFGAGYNIICSDKKQLDVRETREKLRKWGKIKYHLYNGEFQYKDTKRRIIAEEFIGNSKGISPDDYKIYCFNGVPRAILVMTGRGGKMSTVFMNPEWECIGYTNKYDSMDCNIDKPAVLDEMIEFAKAISRDFPFVRVDVYVVNNRLYFGEMTFTPAGGIYCSEIDIDGKNMGAYLEV